jgi:3-oxoacyl-[acyl-carrier protein] reductase
VRPKDPDIPAGRLGRFDDVAQAVRYLTSPEASYVTGNNLVVAGGWKL